MRKAEHFRQRATDAGCSGFWRVGLGGWAAAAADAAAEVLRYRRGAFGEGDEGICKSSGHLDGCG